MKRAEMIAAAEKAGITKQAATKAVDEVVKAMQDALTNGDEVRIDGIGSLSVKEVGERVCRNPSTGEPLTVPAHKDVKFKAFDSLKKKVNGQE